MIEVINREWLVSDRKGLTAQSPINVHVLKGLAVSICTAAGQVSCFLGQVFTKNHVQQVVARGYESLKISRAALNL